MRQEVVNRVLLRTIPLAAPFVIFGILYVLAIVPARDAAAAESARAETVRATLLHTQVTLRKPSIVPVVPAHVVEVRTPRDVAEAVRGLAASPSVGGVEHLAVDINGATVSVNFEARAAQLNDFFSRLGMLAGAVEMRSVDVVSAATAPLVRASLVLFVRELPRIAEGDARLVADASAGQKREVAAEPDPVVHAILFSSQQKSALVDSRIVQLGDRVGPGTVRAIEADAVVLESEEGRVKRLALRQGSRAATR